MINIVSRIDDQVKVSNVIVSVSDKQGLDKLVPSLLEINPHLRVYSTGGTYLALRQILGEQRSSDHLISISDYTGQPEMQGGLVKTLDYKIYMGILSETYNDAHAADLARVRGVAFDMVVVNLYPFKATVADKGVTPEKARANIDIGGPCMVRAAAKNFIRVAAVTDPADYSRIVAELRQNGGRISLRTRFELARKAFAHTAEYDAAITEYLNSITLDRVTGCYTMS